MIKVKESVFRQTTAGLIAIAGLLCLLLYIEVQEELSLPPPNPHQNGTQPLVMQGGDPYIRALMRTISASEANVAQPYSVIYGGTQVSNLSNHPQKCITIVSGPNKGNCSTAAGRYQMINTTWLEKAQRYHPKPSQFLFWTWYGFGAKYQDAVVYAWLSDSRAWGVDIAQLLRSGKLPQVLRRLSGTWTSLGYGIETNSMSGRLPKIYQEILQEELQSAEEMQPIHSL